MYKNWAFQQHISSKYSIWSIVYQHRKCYFYYMIDTLHIELKLWKNCTFKKTTKMFLLPYTIIFLNILNK